MIKRSYFYHARVYQHSSAYKFCSGVVTYSSWFSNHSKVFDETLKNICDNFDADKGQVSIITLVKLL